MEYAAVHLTISLVMFLVINWIGSHAGGFGYRQLTVTATPDEAPAFNFVYRIGAPLVGLSVTAATMYGIGADAYVERLYMVAIYYVIIRISFIVLTGRAKLLNWPAHLLISALIVVLSYGLYNAVLRHRNNILPDFASVANEFWILVVLFVFQVMNRFRTSSVGTEKRKLRYMRSVYQDLRDKYADVIETLNDRRVQAFAYAVAIYESFNRPAIYRWLERNLLFPIGKSRTLGVMQIQTSRRINDYESVHLGVKKIKADYEREYAIAKEKWGEESDWTTDYALRQVAASYNRDDDYIREVLEIYEVLRDKVHLEGALVSRSSGGATA